MQKNILPFKLTLSSFSVVVMVMGALYAAVYVVMVAPKGALGTWRSVFDGTTTSPAPKNRMSEPLKKDQAYRPSSLKIDQGIGVVSRFRLRSQPVDQQPSEPKLDARMLKHTSEVSKVESAST